MKRNVISSIIMIVSILSILAVASNSAHAANRHEFRKVSVASGPTFENNAGLPSCEAPMMLFQVPQDGIIYTTGEDVTLTAKQIKAVDYFVSESGSAAVCQEDGVLVITGNF